MSTLTNNGLIPFDPAHPLAKNLNYSQGIILPFDPEDINNFSTVNIQNGATKITLIKDAGDTTTSIVNSQNGSASNSKILTTPGSVAIGPQGGILSTTPIVAASTTSTSFFGSLTSNDYLLIAGGLAAVIGFYLYVHGAK